MATDSGLIQNRTKKSGLPVIDLVGGFLLVVLSVISLLALVLPMIVIVIVSFDSGPILRFPPAEFSIERYIAVINNREADRGYKTKLIHIAHNRID